MDIHQLEAIGDKYEFTLDTPIEDISDHALNIILYGSDEVFKVKADNYGVSASYALSFEGIASFYTHAVSGIRCQLGEEMGLWFYERSDVPCLQWQQA